MTIAAFISDEVNGHYFGDFDNKTEYGISPIKQHEKYKDHGL